MTLVYIELEHALSGVSSAQKQNFEFEMVVYTLYPTSMSTQIMVQLEVHVFMCVPWWHYVLLRNSHKNDEVYPVGEG